MSVRPQKLKLYGQSFIMRLFYLTLLCSLASAFPEFNITEGVVNEASEGISDSVLSQVYYFDVTNDMFHQNHHKVKIRIFTSVNSPVALRECPLLFTVQGRRNALSWELPVTHTNGNTDEVIYYPSIARTLCLDPSATIEQTIVIVVTSCSPRPIPFTILVTVREDLAVGYDETVSTIVSPTLPDYYKFAYGTEDRPNLMIRLSSPEETCMIFSIQDLECPVMDQEVNVQFEGYWQTMSTKAALTVRKNQFPDGFMLVFVVLKEDKRCEEYYGIVRRDEANRFFEAPILGEFDSPRIKNVTFVIEEIMDASQYVVPTLMPLLFTFLLIFAVLAVFSGFQNLKVRVAGKDQIDIIISGSINSSPSPSGSSTMELASTNIKSCFSAWQIPIKIQDLKKVDPKILRQQSTRYFWTILIIAIFYCVPVFQLITNYLKVVYRTGEQDICYYNYLCARMLGYLMDFNHIYSNISYIILGITFIILVRIRRNSFIQYTSGSTQVLLENNNVDPTFLRRIFPILDSYNDYGVLQHFGLFYAMGLALVAEGILSGAYHICPNQSNFQFDTSFMYVIAVLGLVKIYQFRHPIHISVNVTFVLLAFVSSSAVLGLLFNNTVFKVCFSVVYGFTILILLVYLYWVGYIKDEHDEIVSRWVDVYNALMCRVLGEKWSDKWDSYSYDSHRSQWLLPIGTLFFNSLFIIMQWTLMYDSDFATQLLGIFVMNCFVYTFYYAVMKFIHGEYKGYLWVQSCLYFILAALFWGFSLSFFISTTTSWSESPASSKTFNDDCIVADFYDNHDLWHFLSAGALFCSFMMLLTLDDDLFPVKHSEIAVF